MTAQKQKWLKIIIALVLVAFIVLSVTWGRNVATSPQTYATSIQKIDDQKLAVMGMCTIVTVTSTLLTAIPDDIASPIADELSELSTPLLLIICILYAEKYLITTMGFAATVITLPLSAFAIILYLFKKHDRYFVWAKKMLILSVALLLMIPLSIRVTFLVENTFSESINMTYEAAERLSAELEESDESDQNGFLKFLKGIKDNILVFIEKAKGMLNTMIDAVAVMLISNCVMPALTILAFLYIIKIVFHMPIVTCAFPKQYYQRLIDKRKSRKRTELAETNTSAEHRTPLQQ